MPGLAGALELGAETTMDVSVTGTGVVTVRVAEPAMLPYVAVIVAVPAATAVTIPLEPAALLTVATDGADEVHTTIDVTVFVLPSEKVPVAVNGWTAPTAMLVPADELTLMDLRYVELTFRVAEPDITVEPDPYVAVIVVMPAAKDVAIPWVPAMAATDGADELQVTDAVRF